MIEDGTSCDPRCANVAWMASRSAVLSNGPVVASKARSGRSFTRELGRARGSVSA